MFDSKKEKKEKKENKLFDKNKKPECGSTGTQTICKEKKETEKVVPQK